MQEGRRVTNYTEQLKRDGNLLTLPKPAGRKPRRPLPKTSKKRGKEGRRYSAKRKAFLEAHPACEVIAWKRLPECTFRATDIHHRAKRGKNYLNEATWISACRTCHNWIHNHPKEARNLGLLA